MSAATARRRVDDDAAAAAYIGGRGATALNSSSSTAGAYRNQQETTTIPSSSSAAATTRDLAYALQQQQQMAPGQYLPYPTPAASSSSGGRSSNNTHNNANSYTSGYPQQQPNAYSPALGSADLRSTNSGGAGASSAAGQQRMAANPNHAIYPPSSVSQAHAAASSNGSNYTNHVVNNTSMPLRTQGPSWSLQRDGDRQVIVIEDTPPPQPSSAGGVPSSNTFRGIPAQPGVPQYPGGAYASNGTSTSAAAAVGGGINATKRLKYNGTTSNRSSAATQYVDQTHMMANAQPGPSNYAGNHEAAAAAAAAGALASSSSSRKASGAKRKYNEVVDPATANDRLYAAKAALPCDDKDGHYLIRADDELGDTRRYKIIKLLGQGTFGKVVEAWDRDARCLVAVKVIRAIQKYRDASKVEIKVLNLLRERDPHNVNKCIHLLDCFDHRNHICIVTKLLSCSVFDFLKDNNYLPFPASHIQSFAKQLLTSVAFLHDLRLVHTDLKPENILLVDSDYITIPYKPTKAAPQVKGKRILKNSNIHLIDFGSATFEEDYHASVVSTRHYRAPEIILGLGWSYPCDVWSIGCILVEFYTGEALFQTHENLEHLAMMEVVFGRLPESRWGKLALRSKPEWFHQGTKINYPTPGTSRQSKKYVRAMKPLESVIPATNIVNSRFLDLLSHLLKWDPSERYTVKEALRHPFFSIKIDDEETKHLSQLG